MFKKLIPVFASLILAAASIGATKSPATINNTESSKHENSKVVDLSAGTPATLQIGNLGVDVTKAGTNGEVDLSRTKTAKADHMPTQGAVKIVQPVENFKVDSTTESTDQYIHGQTYIYFDLTHNQATQYNNGNLAIYHFNTSTNSWQQMPTIFVNRGSYGRLAAVATGYGSYALGMATASK